MTAKAKADISDTQAELTKLREDVADLQAEMRDEAEEIARKWEEALDDIEEVRVTPRRTDIDVELFALAWTPSWEVTFDERGRERTSAVPAHRP
jgi:polyhydroxyalkanoate synthesis regulator phasin